MADRIVEIGPNSPGQRSTAEIVQKIVQDFQEIVRSEIQLAKTELTERGKQAGKAAGVLGGGLVLCAFAGGLVIIAGVAAMALVMPVWLACLLMAVFLLIVGGGMAIVGQQRLKQTSIKPEKTIQSVKGDVQWLKQQTR
ncbi:MAG: phage holin family protein [Acidobacteria bacterium]|nr:phage holin family protein [Acidobacteriota bacterium]